MKLAKSFGIVNVNNNDGTESLGDFRYTDQTESLGDFRMLCRDGCDGGAPIVQRLFHSCPTIGRAPTLLLYQQLDASPDTTDEVGVQAWGR